MTAQELLALPALVLPDPRDLSTAGLASGFGMSLGVCLGHALGLPHDRISHLARDDACAGFIIAGAAWLVAAAIDLL